MVNTEIVLDFFWEQKKEEVARLFRALFYVFILFFIIPGAIGIIYFKIWLSEEVSFFTMWAMGLGFEIMTIMAGAIIFCIGFFIKCWIEGNIEEAIESANKLEKKLKKNG